MPEDFVIADGMMVIWTIERPDGDEEDGVYVDDIKDNVEDAANEVAKRGRPWRMRKLVVPYTDPKEGQ